MTPHSITALATALRKQTMCMVLMNNYKKSVRGENKHLGSIICTWDRYEVSRLAWKTPYWISMSSVSLLFSNKSWCWLDQKRFGGCGCVCCYYSWELTENEWSKSLFMNAWSVSDDKLAGVGWMLSGQVLIVH